MTPLVVVAFLVVGLSTAASAGVEEGRGAYLRGDFTGPAQQGNAEAQFRLGLMYQKGEGVRQSYPDALRLFKAAAAQNYALAQNALGLIYATGQGVTKTEYEAVDWLRLAAEKGNAAAQVNLAHAYNHGLGVTEDNAEALTWYRRAAQQGHARAEYFVGYFYANGRGTWRNDTEALKWFRRAADQGEANAQAALAAHLERGRGEGLPVDGFQAYVYLALAATNPRPPLQGREAAAAARDRVLGTLALPELQRATNLVRAWKPTAEKQ